MKTISCSQCGGEFQIEGREVGFSHCLHHNPHYLAPGVYYGINPSRYHAYSAPNIPLKHAPVSKSMLWSFYPNPQRWLEAPPFAGNASTEWGSLIDCLLLTPHLFGEEYAVRPDTYQAPASAKKDAPLLDKPWNANATACKDWLKEQRATGRSVIDSATLAEAEKAVAKIKQHPDAAALLDGCATQVAIVVNVEGRAVKGLLDVVPDKAGKYGNALCDLKTFRGWAPDDFARQVGSLGYHVQAALYLDLWNLTHPDDQRDRWLFILSESAQPYTAGVLELHPDAIEAGREWYRHALGIYNECIESGDYPSPYSDGVVMIDLKSWDYKKTYASVPL